MGMGLRRRGGRRHGGRRHRRVGIGRRKRLRFGRRRRRGGRGLGSLIFLCCMGGARKDISYGQDIQELQQQQMMMIQAIQMQQQQQQFGQQQMFGQPLQPVGHVQEQHVLQQQQYSGQQPYGQQQQQQYVMTFLGMPVAHGSHQEFNNEHVQELQEEQMELLKEIMKRQTEEKDPEVLQALFNEQNMLLQQMSQLQTAGYTYPEPLPTPTAPPAVQPQGVPMDSENN